MGLTIVQVDAFTSTRFAGNPAAVCVLPAPRDERWMQDVAREMNLSETSFLLPENTGYRLRWFTPAAEVALCGHATLASAHVLWETGTSPPGRRPASIPRAACSPASGGATGSSSISPPPEPPPARSPLGSLRRSA